VATSHQHVPPGLGVPAVGLVASRKQPRDSLPGSEHEHRVVHRLLRERVSCVLLFLLASLVEIFTFVLFVAQERLVSGGRRGTAGWRLSVRGGSGAPGEPWRQE
jgi:hypothetical protein